MSWKEEYKKRYHQLKESGKPFFPYAVFKDTLVSVIILIILCLLAWQVGAHLEDLADPTDTTYNPRPEWYFLFLFEALKYFPGHMEAVVAIILPSVVVVLLFLLPFLDRGPKRHPLDRPLLSGVMVFAVGLFVFLTWVGARSPLTNPVIEKDPAVLAGQRLFRDLNCIYCHQVKGKGGKVGPALDKIGYQEEDWLRKHFKDPKAVKPGSTMPKLNLLDDEIEGLVAYIQEISGGEPFTDEAPGLLEENCLACHSFKKKGGDLAGDLATIASARDKNYIKKYIEDPTTMNPNSTMPGYQGILTETQIEDMTRYIIQEARK